MPELEAFEEHRVTLFNIAYRMTGSVMDAEDMVQESFLRWQRLEDKTAVRSVKAYLCTIVTRLCLDHLQSARMQRESYIGPWLPAPLLTDTRRSMVEDVALAETVSTAFLVLLEQLTPVERAVFLLHDVFNYRYDEIAKMVNKTAANCRQLGRRARVKIGKEEIRPRFTYSPEQRAQLTQSFVQTCTTGNMSQLLTFLAKDVVLYSDGGGKVAAARRPIFGPDRVGRFLLGLMKQSQPTMQYRFRELNGELALIVSDAKNIIVTMAPVWQNERIVAIHMMRNPDKLTDIANEDA